MKIEYLSSTVGASSLSMSVTANKPTGVVKDVLMVATMICNLASTFSLAGWTRPPGASAGTASDILYRVAGASEGASYTFAGSSALSTYGVTIAAYTGVDPDNPIDIATFFQSAAGTSAVQPSIDVRSADLLLSTAIRQGSTAALTKPGSMIEDYQTNTVHASAAASEILTGGGGATGTRTWTWSGTSQVGGGLLALRARRESVGRILI